MFVLKILFDIMQATHVSVGEYEGGRERMIRELTKRYNNITQFQIKSFFNLCKSCEKRSEKKGNSSEADNFLLILTVDVKLT